MPQTYTATTTVDIRARREAVWRALVEPDLVARYMHGTSVESDWTVGSPIIWRGEWQGRRYEDKGEVLTFEPPRRLAVTHWSPLTGEEDVPASYHHVSYELQTLDNGSTRVTLTHGNSPSQQAADAMITNGWEPALQGLKRVAEALSDARPG